MKNHFNIDDLRKKVEKFVIDIETESRKTQGQFLENNKQFQQLLREMTEVQGHICALQQQVGEAVVQSDLEDLEQRIRNSVLAVSGGDLHQFQRELRAYYQTEAESVITLDIGEQRKKIRVDQLFVNLAIVEEETQRLQERQALEKESQQLNPKMLGHVEQTTFMNRNDFMGGLISLGSVTAARDVRPELKRLHDSESIYSPKTVIKPHDLFAARTLRGGQYVTPHELVLLGKAGVGKTTLCRYLAYCWSSPLDLDPQLSLWQSHFYWVFYLRLKEVANLEFSTNDAHLVHKILYQALWNRCGMTEEQSELLWNVLRCTQPEKILFILDGYDEVAEHSSLPCETLMSVRQTHSNKIHVLTTSRPHAKISKSADIVLENIGFVDEDIPLYIDRYFDLQCEVVTLETVEQSAETLKEFLKLRPKIHQICHVPINLELLCSIWTEHQQKAIEKEELVMSDLYQRMLGKLMRRYLKEKTLLTGEWSALEDKIALEDETHAVSRTIMTHPHSQIALKFLEEFAFEGFKTGNLILTREVFKKLQQKYKDEFTDAIDYFLKAGFLKAVGDINASKMAKEYYFIHLSFQEYLAARYFAKQFIVGRLTTDDRDFFQEQKYNPRYLLVWTYVAGVIRTQRDEWENDDLAAESVRVERGLRCFFQALFSAPRDLYGAYEMELLVRCGEETKWLDLPTTNALLEYLGHWVMGITHLHEGEDREQLLRYLNQLFLTCPLAMANVRYKSKKQLFNFLTHEAKTPVRVKWFVDMSLFFFPGGSRDGFWDKVRDDCFLPITDITDNCYEPIRDNCCEPIADISASNDFFRCCTAVLCCAPAFGLGVVGSVLMGVLLLILFLPSILFTIFPGLIIVNLLANFYYFPLYQQRQQATAALLKLFQFDDIQIVRRIVTLLRDAEDETCLRLIQAFEPINFVPLLRPFIREALRHILHTSSNIQVKHAAWRRFVQFQPEGVSFFTFFSSDEAFTLFNTTLYHLCFEIPLSRTWSAEDSHLLNPLFFLLDSIYVPQYECIQVVQKVPEKIDIKTIVIEKEYSFSFPTVYWMEGEIRKQKKLESKDFGKYPLPGTDESSTDFHLIMVVMSLCGATLTSEIKPVIKAIVNSIRSARKELLQRSNRNIVASDEWLNHLDLADERTKIALQHHFPLVCLQMLRTRSLEYVSSLRENLEKLLDWQMKLAGEERKRFYVEKFGYQAPSLVAYHHYKNISLKNTPEESSAQKKEILNTDDTSIPVSPVERQDQQAITSILRETTDLDQVRSAIERLSLPQLQRLVNENSKIVLAHQKDFIDTLATLNIFSQQERQALSDDLKNISRLSMQNVQQTISSLRLLSPAQKEQLLKNQWSSDKIEVLQNQTTALCQQSLYRLLWQAALVCADWTRFRYNLRTLVLPMLLLYTVPIVFIGIHFGVTSFLLPTVISAVFLLESLYRYFHHWKPHNEFSTITNDAIDSMIDNFSDDGSAGFFSLMASILSPSIAGLLWISVIGLIGLLLLGIWGAVLLTHAILTAFSDRGKDDKVAHCLVGSIAFIMIWPFKNSLKETVRLYQTLVLLRKHFLNDIYIETLLQHYPSYQQGCVFDSTDALSSQLRRHLSQHHTAIWQRADGTFAWYIGRSLFEFSCDHPSRLKRDIRSIRLLSDSFNVPWDFSCTFGQTSSDIKKENYDDIDSLEKENNALVASYWRESIAFFRQLETVQAGNVRQSIFFRNQVMNTEFDDRSEQLLSSSLVEV